MPNPKHTHTFVKYKRRPGFWRCAAPKCTYMLDEESVLGKASLCNICGAEFILSRSDLRRIRPRCIKCSDTKEGKNYRSAMAAINAILPDLEEFSSGGPGPGPGPGGTKSELQRNSSSIDREDI